MRKVLISLMLAITIVACNNDKKMSPEEIKANLEADLTKQVSGLSIDQIRTTKINGIYEVIADDNKVFYVSEDGKFAIFGKIVDLTAKEHVGDQ